MTKRVYPAAGVPSDAILPTTQFARSPSDALQCLLDLKHLMQRVHDAGPAPDGEPISRFIAPDAEWGDWQAWVDQVEPFFWPSHTAALVTAASASYPIEPEAAVLMTDIAQQYARGSVTPPSYMPRRPRGLHVFDRPCLFVEIDGRVEPLSALGWNCGFNVACGELWLSLRGVVWTPYGAVVTWWSDGGSAEVADNAVDGTFRAERLRFTQWVCTAAMFLEQEIVASSRAVVSRGVRKRCERAARVATCHVVMLRKELDEDHRGTGLSHVEWSHRWLVRGHWRRQFYPSRGGHAPTWIHPHVKGPSDKPFVEPHPTVFSVAR